VIGNGKLIVLSRLKFSSDHKQIVESDDPESCKEECLLSLTIVFAQLQNTFNGISMMFETYRQQECTYNKPWQLSH